MIPWLVGMWRELNGFVNGLRDSLSSFEDWDDDDTLASE